MQQAICSQKQKQKLYVSDRRKFISPLNFADILWMKTMRWQQMYDEYVLKGMFVEGLPFSITRSILEQ